MKKNGPPWFSNLIYPLMKLHQFLRIFFCVVLMAAVGSKPAFAQSPLDKTVTINLSNVPLKQALDKLTVASGVRFTYNDAVATSNIKITINAKAQSLRQVLETALAVYPYIFTVLDQDILIRYDVLKIKKSGAGPAAKPATGKYTISGTITSKQSGETMIGATVRVDRKSGV